MRFWKVNDQVLESTPYLLYRLTLRMGHPDLYTRMLCITFLYGKVMAVDFKCGKIVQLVIVSST